LIVHSLFIRAVTFCYCFYWEAQQRWIATSLRSSWWCGWMVCVLLNVVL